MSKKPVLIYGASGYTGRLIAEALRNFEIPFIAAGRNAARIEEAMKLVPGIETAEYEIVEVAHDVDALAQLFSRSEVVCSSVGPFTLYGETVVAACAKAKVHYTDSSGEQDFIDAMGKKYGDAFAANGKVLAPGTAYMWTHLEIAAHIVLEKPGIDSVDAFTSAAGIPTFGSTQTIFTMFDKANSSFYIENNKRELWPEARGFEVSVPGKALTQLMHPWGGGTLPVFFENDPRVRNMRQITGFTNRPMMEGLIAMQTTYKEGLEGLTDEEKRTKLAADAAVMQPGMPPRENPLVHRCVDVAMGRGGNSTNKCTIYSYSPYYATGVLHAALANHLIGGRQLGSGFLSSCQAVGHREMLAALENQGLCRVEIE